MAQTDGLAVSAHAARRKARAQNLPRRVLLIALLIPVLVAAGAFRLSEGYFRSEELAKAQGRLSLYRGTVVAQLERFAHLTYVLARDPFVIATAAGGPVEPLDARLAGFADRAGLDAIYLMDTEGLTISASNAGEPGSFVGQTYSFRPYFQQALKGAQGEFYGIGSTTGLPGYFYAEAVRAPGGGEITGVIAIKLSLTPLETQWREAGERVLLANRDGVVLLSSEPEWRYTTLQPLTEAQRDRIRQTRQFGAQPLAPLEWQRQAENGARLMGEEFLHLSTSDLPNGWALHYLSSTEPVSTRSLLVTGGMVIFAGVILILTQQRRTARIGAALRRSEAEEALLREANDRLAVEIEERRAAERRLERTQDELERASRLAALGKLAASVTHELGQPIAAMRNHLTAAEFGGAAREGLTGRIAGLVDRMESITRQLKFFARGEESPIGEVDLRDAVRASVALVEPNLTASETELELDLPERPVMVRGNQFRLEQVLTNLMRNGVDAMGESAERRLVVSAGADAAGGWCEVADTGHGLGGAALEELQEPFYTTRATGHGMGLGLAISASIVEEHGGRMSTRERAGGGTVFRVEIPLVAAEEEGRRA
ncbi:MAG: ATP-binding protein [Roseovarius sp.]